MQLCRPFGPFCSSPRCQINLSRHFEDQDGINCVRCYSLQPIWYIMVLAHVTSLSSVTKMKTSDNCAWNWWTLSMQSFFPNIALGVFRLIAFRPSGMRDPWCFCGGWNTYPTHFQSDLHRVHEACRKTRGCANMRRSRAKIWPQAVKAAEELTCWLVEFAVCCFQIRSTQQSPYSMHACICAMRCKANRVLFSMNIWCTSLRRNYECVEMVFKQAVASKCVWNEWYPREWVIFWYSVTNRSTHMQVVHVFNLKDCSLSAQL